MAEDKVNVVIGAEVGDPVPREHAFEADDQVIPALGDQFQECLWRGFNVFVNELASGIIENTDVEGTGMQVNSAGISVLLGIESHRVFSYGLRDLPVYRFGGKLEGKAQ
jgi:hypothetical protein